MIRMRMELSPEAHDMIVMLALMATVLLAGRA